MSRTILIVDDSLVERTILEGYLKSEYNVIQAATGEEAIEILKAKQHTVTAVIMDVMMPGMDGYETLKIIKENPNLMSIPVIISTGLDDDDSREKAIIYGAESFISKPFNRSLLMHVLNNAVKMSETAALANKLRRDSLTNLLNRDSFFFEAERLIKRHEPGYYVLSCFDVENFKVINDQYGTEIGDGVLKHIAACLNAFVTDIEGLTCRYTADKFAILYPAIYKDTDEIIKNHKETTKPKCIGNPIKIRIGRYLINDTSIPVSAMFDRAALAEDSVKGQYNKYIADYTDAMRESILNEQRIVNDMDKALDNLEFEPWIQPQYNHATGELIGGEALVRWRKDGKFISPGVFIPVFERNGFIYEMDKSIWGQVCDHMRRWLDEGKNPLPVSINISRIDLLHSNFISSLTEIINKRKLPYELIRLEVTESALGNTSVIARVEELIKLGFTVEIDDFGSGYSSLNTLKDVPATILKLDMRFFDNTKYTQRSGNIVESVVRMAKWLGMAVIAEGVEEKSQADYLKSIGCYYIQGYFYAKPMPVNEFESLMEKSVKEPKLSVLKTLETLDNNEFWNPKSIDTLIFNSYVGGACIFEINDGKSELLRINEQYIHEFGGLLPPGTPLSESSMVKFLDENEKNKALASIKTSIESQRESTCELCLSDGVQKEFIRATLRIIARADTSYLLYAVILNITEQRKAEIKEHNTAVQMSAILNNMRGGVIASILNDNDEIEILFTNSRYYEMYGYTKEQFDSEVKNVFDLIHPDDREKSLAEAKKALNERSTATYEMRCIKRDGSVIWQQMNNSVMLLEEYSSPILLAVTNDITEMRDTQQKLIFTAERLKAVMNNVENGITAVIMHENGTEFLFANDKYYELHGVTNENYNHKEIYDSFKLVHPDDRESVRKAVTSCSQDGQHSSIEYRLILPDNKVCWMKAIISVTRFKEYEMPVQVTVFMDISADKLSSEQLHFLNNSAHDILAQADSDAGIDATLTNLCDYFIADRAYLIELDYEKRVTNNTYEICSGKVESEMDSLKAIPFSESDYWYRLLMNGDIVAIKSIDDISDEQIELRELLKRQNIHSMILAPHFNEGKLVAFSGLDNPKRSADEANQLKGLAAYISILISRRNVRAKIDSDRHMMQALMDDTPGGFVRMKLIDKRTFIPIYSNEGFARMLKMTQEELHKIYKDDVLNGVHPDDRNIVSDAGLRMLKYGKAESARFRVKDGDGNWVWLTLYGRVTKDATGDIYLNVYYSDATRLVSEEQKQNELLDNLPCGAALYEFDGKEITVIHINKRYWKLVERQENNYDDISVFDMIHPEDKQYVLDELKTAIRDSRSVSVNFRVKHGKSGYRVFHVSANTGKLNDGKYKLFVTYFPID